jgi:hypothetical protein
MQADWSTFFSAQVGAGAALTGLVFVALSINLKQILAYPGLPARSAEAVLLLLQPVVLGAVALIPGQPLLALGIETVVIGGTTWFQITGMMYRARALLAAQPRNQWATRLVFAEASTISCLVAGGLLVFGVSQGLFVLAAGVLLCTLDGVLDAWVLLVEILR